MILKNTKTHVLGLMAFISAMASFSCHATDDSDWVTIHNGDMWIDSDGNDVQAHGAGFLKVDDTWYMIGEDRTKQWNPDVNMYSSKDLVNWKFERKIIENGVTPGIGQNEDDRAAKADVLSQNKKICGLVSLGKLRLRGVGGRSVLLRQRQWRL